MDEGSEAPRARGAGVLSEEGMLFEVLLTPAPLMAWTHCLHSASEAASSSSFASLNATLKNLPYSGKSVYAALNNLSHRKNGVFIIDRDRIGLHLFPAVQSSHRG